MERLVTPHDLLRLAPAGWASWNDVPSWVEAALLRAPFVVVRRAGAKTGFTAGVANGAVEGTVDEPLFGGDHCVPVGVRGSTRCERFGTWLDTRHILEIVKPEDLRAIEPSSALPAFALLRQIASICNDTGFVWGPTGSVGFELASRVATVTESSDLDLLMRVPKRIEQNAAAAIFERLVRTASSTRIDVQIETAAGVFSLAEYARPHWRVLLRGSDGPKFVTDPWCVEREQLA
jgi:phosphoribosyl-dephospho-CoA transferase